MTTDWYALLGVARDAALDQIEAAVQKRARQAAALANTSPERSQQLREQVRAIKRDLLSGPENRTHYDTQLATESRSAQSAPVTPRVPPTPALQQDVVAPSHYPQQPQPPLQQRSPQGQGRFRQFLRSGWTCWNCGHDAGPGDRFCTQCRAQLARDVTFVPASAPVSNPNACPYCATIAASTHRFCRTCGAGRG